MFEVCAAAEGHVGQRAGYEDDCHEAARWLVSLHRDIASLQAGNCLAVHGYHSRSSFRPGRHGRLDRYGMRSAVGRENSQVVEADVGQMGIASGKAGELGVVLKVADKGVLVVVVHVGDDALLRCCIGGLGGLVRHGGCR